MSQFESTRQRLIHIVKVALPKITSMASLSVDPPSHPRAVADLSTPQLSPSSAAAPVGHNAQASRKHAQKQHPELLCATARVPVVVVGGWNRSMMIIVVALASVESLR